MVTLRIVHLQHTAIRPLSARERMEQHGSYVMGLLAGTLQTLLAAGVFTEGDRRSLVRLCNMISYTAHGAFALGQVGPHLPGAKTGTPPIDWARSYHGRERVLRQITPLEMEFLQRLCAKHEPNYKQIAAAMGVKRSTLNTYRVSLYEKFGVKSKMSLVRFALRWRLIG